MTRYAVVLRWHKSVTNLWDGRFDRLLFILVMIVAVKVICCPFILPVFQVMYLVTVVDT